MFTAHISSWQNNAADMNASIVSARLWGRFANYQWIGTFSRGSEKIWLRNYDKYFKNLLEYFRVEQDHLGKSPRRPPIWSSSHSSNCISQVLHHCRDIKTHSNIEKHRNHDHYIIHQCAHGLSNPIGIVMDSWAGNRLKYRYANRKCRGRQRSKKIRLAESSKIWSCQLNHPQGIQSTVDYRMLSNMRNA